MLGQLGPPCTCCNYEFCQSFCLSCVGAGSCVGGLGLHSHSKAQCLAFHSAQHTHSHTCNQNCRYEHPFHFHVEQLLSSRCNYDTQIQGFRVHPCVPDVHFMLIGILPTALIANKLSQFPHPIANYCWSRSQLLHQRHVHSFL